MHHHTGPHGLPDGGGTGRRLGTVLLAALLGLIVVLLGTGPAAAHAELESSSPKDGATLASAPDQIALTFGEDLLDTGNAITLTAAGLVERLPLAEPTVDGDTISVPWPPAAPAGEFTAAYRVVSADGHPVEGTITFTVREPTGPTSVAAPGPVAVAGAPSGLPSAVAAAPSSPTATPGGAAPESQPEAGVLAWVLGIGVIALVAALAATWVTRRTRQ